MEVSLGIDLGTSNTKLAIRGKGGITSCVPIGKGGQVFMPSVVAYRRTKNDLAEVEAVGEAADELLDSEDRIVVRDIKRCLISPRAGHDDGLSVYRWWDCDTRTVRLWKAVLSPQDVLTEILGEALSRVTHCASELGLDCRATTFGMRSWSVRTGIPVLASKTARDGFVEVMRRLGYSSFRIVDLWEEPTLASLPYAVLGEVREDDLLLIYDLGGGTFDTAVVRVDGYESESLMPRLTVLASDGETRCGGTDIDQALSSLVLDRIANEMGFAAGERESLASILSRSEMAQVVRYSREAKEGLSHQEDYHIAFPPGFLGENGLEVELTRGDLQTALDRTRVEALARQCVLRAWRRARMYVRFHEESAQGGYLSSGGGVFAKPITKLGDDDIRRRVDKILLVGGVTNIPALRERITASWGGDKIVSQSIIAPMEAVAKGAASDSIAPSAVVERYPFSLYLAAEGGVTPLYQAYSGTMTYPLMGNKDCVEFVVSLPVTYGSKARIVLEPADGSASRHYDLDTRLRNPTLMIDSFGRILVRGGRGEPQEFDNPFRHSLQKEQFERVQAEQAEREKVNHDRETAIMYRLPYEID